MSESPQASAPAFVGTSAAASSSSAPPRSMAAGTTMPATTATTTKLKAKRSSRASGGSKAAASGISATACASAEEAHSTEKKHTSASSTAVSVGTSTLGLNFWNTEIEEALTCVICLSSPLLDPVTVPCGHSFDKACLDMALRADRSLKCPVCRKSLPHTAEFGVSITLRDMINRTFPEELLARRQGAVEEELRHGRVSSTTVDWMTERMRSAGRDTNMRELLKTLRTFGNAVCSSGGGGHGRIFEAPRLEAGKVLAKVADAAWTLLKRAPSREDPIGLGTFFKGMVEVLKQLVEFTLRSSANHSFLASMPGSDMDLLARDSLEQLACVWLLPVEATRETIAEAARFPSRQDNNRMVRLLEGCRFIEVVLRSMLDLNSRFTWNVASQAFGIFTSIFKEIRDLQRREQQELDDDGSDDLGDPPAGTSSNRMEEPARLLAMKCLEHVTNMSHDLVCADWRTIRQDMAEALLEESSSPCVAALAEVLRKLLGTIGSFEPPGEAWLGTALQGVQKHLMSTAVTDNYDVAKRLLRLLGKIYSSFRNPYSDIALKRFVGNGMWQTSCSLVDSAGKAIVKGHHLARDALSAWIELVKFLANLNQAHAEQGLAECHFKLVSFLMQSLEHPQGSEAQELATRLLDDLLALLETIPKSVATPILEPLRWNNAAIQAACGLKLPDKDRSRLHKKIGGKLIRAGILTAAGTAGNLSELGKTAGNSSSNPTQAPAAQSVANLGPGIFQSGSGTLQSGTGTGIFQSGTGIGTGSGAASPFGFLSAIPSPFALGPPQSTASTATRPSRPTMSSTNNNSTNSSNSDAVTLGSGAAFSAFPAPS